MNLTIEEIKNMAPENVKKYIIDDMVKKEHDKKEKLRNVLIKYGTVDRKCYNLIIWFAVFVDGKYEKETVSYDEDGNTTKYKDVFRHKYPQKDRDILERFLKLNKDNIKYIDVNGYDSKEFSYFLTGDTKCFISKEIAKPMYFILSEKNKILFISDNYDEWFRASQYCIWEEVSKKRIGEHHNYMTILFKDEYNMKDKEIIKLNKKHWSECC